MGSDGGPGGTIEAVSAVDEAVREADGAVSWPDLVEAVPADPDAVRRAIGTLRRANRLRYDGGRGGLVRIPPPSGDACARCGSPIRTESYVEVRLAPQGDVGIAATNLALHGSCAGEVRPELVAAREADADGG